MQHQLPRRPTLRGHKPGEAQADAERGAADAPRVSLERHAANLGLDPSLTAGFRLARNVREAEARERDAGRRISHGIAGDELPIDREPIAAEGGQACASVDRVLSLGPSGACSTDFAFSSFIIGEGVVTGPFIFTIRWRSTASLNLNA